MPTALSVQLRTHEVHSYSEGIKKNNLFLSSKKLKPKIAKKWSVSKQFIPKNRVPPPLRVLF